MDTFFEEFIKYVIAGAIGLTSLGGVAYYCFKEDDKKVDESKEIYEPVKSERKTKV